MNETEKTAMINPEEERVNAATKEFWHLGFSSVFHSRTISACIKPATRSAIDTKQ